MLRFDSNYFQIPWPLLLGTPEEEKRKKEKKKNPEKRRSKLTVFYLIWKSDNSLWEISSVPVPVWWVTVYLRRMKKQKK